MRLHRCRAADIDLAVAEAGVGNPRQVLFLHGFGGAKEDFTDWLDPLAGAGWHAVAYDQRGHGASEAPVGQERYSLELLAGDARALVNALDWKGAVLFGHSMGGMVAQRVAIETPLLLDALILMGTSHRWPEGLDPELIALGQEVVRTGGMPALLAALKEFGPGPLDSAANQRLRVTRPGHGEFGERKLLACSPDMWIALTRDMVAQADRLAELARLRLPALVMVGAEDAIFGPQSQAIAAAIPGAELAVIDQAGHSPQFEQPEAWWSALCSFLSRLDPGRERPGTS